MFQIFLALQCIPDIVIRFIIDEAFQPVALGKAADDALAMLPNPA